MPLTDQPIAPSRRSLLNMIGLAAGTTAMYHAMTQMALADTDLTDILYHRHRDIIALPPPDPVVAGLG